MCPECNEWMMLAEIDSGEPTKQPSPKVPTHTPTQWRQWADETWLSDIKRRDSSAHSVSGALGFVTCMFAALYFVH